jgi:hypothetical protein
MLGHIVLRDLQLRRNFVHAQFFLEQEPQHAQPSFLAQCLQRSDTVQSGHGDDVSFAVTGRKQMCRLFPSGLRRADNAEQRNEKERSSSFF